MLLNFWFVKVYLNLICLLSALLYTLFLQKSIYKSLLWHLWAIQKHTHTQIKLRVSSMMTKKDLDCFAYSSIPTQNRIQHLVVVSTYLLGTCKSGERLTLCFGSDCDLRIVRLHPAPCSTQSLLGILSPSAAPACVHSLK